MEIDKKDTYDGVEHGDLWNHVIFGTKGYFEKKDLRERQIKIHIMAVLLLVSIVCTFFIPVARLWLGLLSLGLALGIIIMVVTYISYAKDIETQYNYIELCVDDILDIEKNGGVLLYPVEGHDTFTGYEMKCYVTKEQYTGAHKGDVWRFGHYEEDEPAAM